MEIFFFNILFFRLKIFILGTSGLKNPLERGQCKSEEENKKRSPPVPLSKPIFAQSICFGGALTLPMGVQGSPYRRVSCTGIKMPATVIWQVSLLCVQNKSFDVTNVQKKMK